MTGLSVGECLLEADKRVRETSFEIGSLDHDALVAAWPWFARAAAGLLTALPGPGGGPIGALAERRRDASPAVVAERLRAAPAVRTSAALDPRLAAAAGRYDQAAALVRAQAAAWAPDRDQVASHVSDTVCIAAHVVARAIRDDRASRGRRKTGRKTAAAAVSGDQAGRSAAGEVLRHALLVEDATRVALQRSGRRADGPTDPQGEARVELALRTWLALTARDLQRGVVGVGDLRDVARVNANLAGHTSAVVHAAVHAGALSAAQAEELDTPLSQANRAWAAAAGDWHRQMRSPSLPDSGELQRASIEVDQALASITRVGNRWATAEELTRSADPGRCSSN